MKVIAFLSGRGSNFKSLLDEQRRQKSPSYEIIGVFSDKPGAAGLYYAKEAGIPVHSFFRRDFDSLEGFKKAIFEGADTVGADMIALCGYMQIVPKWFVEKWSGRIINIHPSLLPKFPGLNTHEQALQAKESEHGCTVHFVDSGIDTGTIIAQAKVSILAGDTVEALAAKVLEQEHKIYPWVLSKIASGEITIQNGALSMSEAARSEAASSGFFIPTLHTAR